MRNFNKEWEEGFNDSGDGLVADIVVSEFIEDLLERIRVLEALLEQEDNNV